jgi:hypothetical protein
VILLATFPTQSVTVADVNRHVALKIGQREIHPPVTAERRPKQAEKRLILVDGQELPVAKRPAFGRKAETEDSDFREKWFCHDFLLHRLSLQFRVQSLDCYKLKLEL